MRVETYCSVCGSHCDGAAKGRKEIDILRLVLWVIDAEMAELFGVWV